MPGEDNMEQIERLLALQLIQDRSEIESIELLHRAEYNSSEIGEFIDLNPSTVRNRISELKDEGTL